MRQPARERAGWRSGQHRDTLPVMSDTHESIDGERAVVLDVRGLNCPMPLLKAKKALNDLAPGALLRVVATDPGSVRDFEVFSRQSGHQLLESSEEAGNYRYLLRKKSG